jgi:hypothetical protein
MQLRLVSVLLLAAATARAEDLRPQQMRGLELGVGASYALPLGESAKGARLDAMTAGTIPLRLDVGFRSSAQLFEGVYVAYAPGLSPSGCSDCSAWDLHLGVEAALHSNFVTRFDPWVGLFVGAELLHASTQLAGVAFDSTSRGFEAGMHFGVGMRLAQSVTVGPVLGAGFGEFLSVAGASESADIDEKGMHGWFTFGLRGTFDFADEDHSGSTLPDPIEKGINR